MFKGYRTYIVLAIGIILKIVGMVLKGKGWTIGDVDSGAVADQIINVAEGVAILAGMFFHAVHKDPEKK